MRSPSRPVVLAVAAVAIALIGLGVAIARNSDDGHHNTAASSTESVQTHVSHTASQPSSSSIGSTTSGTGFTPDPVAWTSCGRGVDCATVKVPIDYQDQNGPTIGVAITRLRASDQEHKIGSLLVNPGGPGASGIDFVKGSAAYFDQIAPDFDVIGFDPRGVGNSDELPCAVATNKAFHHLDPSPDSPDEQQQLDDAAKAVADDCAANGGPLLDHVGTDDVVRDMDSIRQAVGDEKLSYVGYSYGTLLGLRYAELFPTFVRAIVLDGVVDPTQDFQTFLRAQTVAFDKNLTDELNACPDGKSGCPDGGATAAYDQIAAEVETNPLPVGSRSVGPNELATAAIYSAYVPDFARQFYGALRDAQQGDGRGLLDMNDGYEDVGHFASYAGVECVDSPHPVGALAFKAFADELTQLSPRFGPSVANELLPCAFWPAPVQSIIGPVHAHGAPPILVIGKTGDPATPYENSVSVAQNLEQARLLTVEGTGHTSLEDPCAQDKVQSYLTDLTLPDEGAKC